jgi:hypothetical protein
MIPAAVLALRRGGPAIVAVGREVAQRPRVAAAVTGGVVVLFTAVGLLALSAIQALLFLTGQSVGFAGDLNAALLPAAAEQSGAAAEQSGAAASLAGTDGAGGVGGAVAAPVAAVASNPGAHPTEPVGPDELVSIDGIRVHRSIGPNLRGLLDAARADGVELAGWGWRDTNAQIRLRRQNCGTSDYAVYRMSSSRCSPPTARPGSSQHERGLAIDFTYSGRSISTHQSPGFRWLNANAAAFGFKNLPSEPWHWSTTGR